MRIMLTGGGTGGHIYPALAVAERMRQLVPGVEFMYVGSARGLEQEIVREAGLRLVTVDTAAVSGQGPVARIRALATIARGVVQALRIMAAFKPRAVIATGGYVSVPTALAAILSRRPLVIHEQNAMPGGANRMLARFAREVYVSDQESRRWFSRPVIVTGNPVRPALLVGDRRSAARRLGIDPDRRTVVMLGGSRGASTLARAISPVARMVWSRGEQLIAATGPGYYEQVMSELRAGGMMENGEGKIIVKPYLHAMGDVLSVADLVVARAGATTLAELTAVGVASVLVPSPNVVSDHQTANARALAARDAAVLVTESEALAGGIEREAFGLLADDDRRAAMAAAARRLGRPDAADEICARVRAIIDR